ncbi:hypothetical protein [Streptomyces sp. NPDC001880]
MDHEGPWRFPQPRALPGPTRKEPTVSTSDRFFLNTLAIMGMHRIESAAEKADSPRDALIEVGLTPRQWQHILLVLSQDGSDRSRGLLEVLSGWDAPNATTEAEMGTGAGANGG